MAAEKKKKSEISVHKVPAKTVEMLTNAHQAAQQAQAQFQAIAAATLTALGLEARTITGLSSKNSTITTAPAPTAPEAPQ